MAPPAELVSTRQKPRGSQEPRGFFVGLAVAQSGGGPHGLDSGWVGWTQK